MIGSKIQSLIAEALKNHDNVRVSTFRLLSSELNYERIAKQHDLNEEEEITVVRREAKKRQEAIQEYEKVKALERAEAERKELEILKEFLPQDLSDDALAELINQAIRETGAQNAKEIGKVIGVVMNKAEGRADGKKVAEIVKQKLT